MKRMLGAIALATLLSINAASAAGQAPPAASPMDDATAGTAADKKADTKTPAPVTGRQADATLDGTNLESLFSAIASAQDKDTSRQYAVKLALAGDSTAAFALGALYRSGPDHPAQATARDLDTARHWLLKCLDADGCPPIALASLAELELEAGNDKPAMQWAQAWAVIDQQIRGTAKPDDNQDGSNAYTAFLLDRCFARLDRRTRNAQAAEWFNELRASKRVQLSRLISTGRAASTAEAGRAESFLVREKKSVYTARDRSEPVMALYLLRAPPGGGPPQAVTLLEGLPRPKKLQDFRGILGRFEFKPNADASADGAKRFVIIPLAYADPRYQLKRSDE